MTKNKMIEFNTTTTDMACEQTVNFFQKKLDRIEAEAEATGDWDEAVPKVHELAHVYGRDVGDIPCDERLACALYRASEDYEPFDAETVARLKREMTELGLSWE